jgi:hypothetical protein
MDPQEPAAVTDAAKVALGERYRREAQAWIEATRESAESRRAADHQLLAYLRDGRETDRTRSELSKTQPPLLLADAVHPVIVDRSSPKRFLRNALRTTASNGRSEAAVTKSRTASGSNSRARRSCLSER